MRMAILPRLAPAAAACIALTAPGPVGGETHRVQPDRYYTTFSFAHPPVARIKPGDRVVTSTLDARGRDKSGKIVLDAGNVLSGPFYIEGAQPGDTLVVRLEKVRLNRDWGWTNGRVYLDALTPPYVRRSHDENMFAEWLQPGRKNAMKWHLDLERNVATATEKLGTRVKFEYPVRPAMGCMGVAPPGKTAITSGPTGPHGGNIDYNGINEGSILYLNVFEPGALFFLGDGHAVHGDGELLGNGTETSMDVEFSVDLIKRKSIGWPRLEQPTHLVTFGTTPSAMKEGFQAAITEMIQWLVQDYGLTHPEAHVMLGMEAELRVAAWGNTFICRLSKQRLPPKTR